MRRSVRISTHLSTMCLALAAGAFISVVSFSVAGQTTASLEWRLLRPEGEEFQILIPKNPVEQVSKMTYHKMELTTRLYLSGEPTGPLFAVASLSGIKSNPAAYSEFQRLNSYVDAFKDWFPEKVRGKEAKLKLTLVGEKTLNGHTGREYRLSIADLTGSAHVYATKRRFYAVAILNKQKDEEMQERFLSSFVLPDKVVDPPPAVAQQPLAEPATPAPATPEVKKPSPDAQKTETNAEPASPEAKAADAAEEKNAQPGQKKPISGGVLNGRALYMPKPEYPPEAQNANASGSVVVQITIDEVGAVISAKAVSGHPTLHQACINAALQARFSPTTLMGEPVKVSGVLTYNFAR